MIKMNVLNVALWLLSLALIGIIFNSAVDDKSFVENAMAAPRSYSKLCGYTNVTSVFQRNGMPALSLIRNIEKIDPRYFSLDVYNRISNQSEIYVYYLGADGVWNTPDDRGFFIDSYIGNWYIAPVLSLPNGSITNDTLYWIKTLPNLSRQVKSCTLTPSGCVNTAVRFTLPFIPLQGFMPSFSQDRFFIAHRNPVINVNGTTLFTSSFKSCSLQQGNPDSCNGNFNNFRVHSDTGYWFHKSLRSVGFVARPVPVAGPVPDYTPYFFDTNDINSSAVEMPYAVDFDSLTSLGTPGVIAGLQQDLNGTMGGDSVVFIYPPSTNSFVIAPLGMLFEKGYLIDLDTNFVALYKTWNSNSIIGEEVLNGRAVEIYSPNSHLDVAPKIVLGDKSILGILLGRANVVKFDCKP